MNYVEHHFGDYARDTAHLSVLEHGAYRLLIDLYYVRERPLPPLAECCRLIRATTAVERKAVDSVLREFFKETADGWAHTRCDAEIARFRDKQAKAKRSAEARWTALRSESDGNANAYANGHANALRPQSEGNAPNHQAPNTKHQKKKKGTAPAALSVSDLVAEGIPEQDATDWFEVRRQKRAGSLTARAWASVKAQAEAAGWTLPEVVRKCADKQWRGFEAHWVADEPRPTQRLTVNAAGQHTLDGFVP